MQLSELCKKKHMVQCSFKSHNKSQLVKGASKIRAMAANKCVFLFLNGATFRGMAKHMELSLSTYIASS